MSQPITTSRRRRLRAGAVGASALIATTMLTPSAGASHGGEGAQRGPRTYQVTVVNLTGGQPLTPPLLATHTRRADVFEVGRPASDGVKEIAENGNTAVLADALEGARRVADVVVGGAPVVPEGRVDETGFPNATTLTIEAGRRANRLTWVSMLICTNDGFTGVDSVRLPRVVGHTRAWTTAGYDAGTELNTEAFADIVPPCQGLVGVSGDPGTGASDPALAEGGVIRHHPGITGGADLLPEVHGWSDPVAVLSVTRIS